MKEILLTEAAKKFGVSRLCIWRAITKGEIKRVRRVGRYTFLDAKEVSLWAKRKQKQISKVRKNKARARTRA